MRGSGCVVAVSADITATNSVPVITKGHVVIDSDTPHMIDAVAAYQISTGEISIAATPFQFVLSYLRLLLHISRVISVLGGFAIVVSVAGMPPENPLFYIL